MPGPTRSLTAEKINERLHQSGVSKSSFAVVVGVSVSSLKDALSGRTFVGSAVEAGWLSVVARLHEFVNALQPLVLVDGHAMKRLLEGDKSPEEVRAMVETIFGE